MSLKSDIAKVHNHICSTCVDNEILDSFNRILKNIPKDIINPPCAHTWNYQSLYTYGSETAGARTCVKCGKYEEGIF